MSLKLPFHRLIAFELFKPTPVCHSKKILLTKRAGVDHKGTLIKRTRIS